MSAQPVAGVLRTYVDSTGRTQRAVDGPNGTFLITSKRDGEPFEVWRSDSLHTIARTRDGAVALARAMRAAGVEL
jgi:hypothetical protein